MIRGCFLNFTVLWTLTLEVPGHCRTSNLKDTGEGYCINSYLSPAELASRMAGGTEKRCWELHFLELRIFGRVAVKSAVDDVVRPPQIGHHVVRVTDLQKWKWHNFRLKNSNPSYKIPAHSIIFVCFPCLFISRF